MDKRISDAEKDAFWDLDALLPKGRTKSVLSPFFREVRTVEVSSPAPQEEKDGRDASVPPRTRLTEPRPEREESDADGEESVEYTPADNDLVTRVRITRRRGDYRFYGQFRKDAIRYLPVEGRECPFVHFFSYIPQYAQLTEAQRAYYFYWRSELRRGNHLRCEESYFYLFVYEIINLPDYIPPKEGLPLLCGAWNAYRKQFPRIDKYMVEWVTDYCLVHALPAPSEALAPFLGKLLPVASFKEFYLGGMGKTTREGVNTALAFFSDYNYRESRYAKEHAALFLEHIPQAVLPVLRDAFADGDSLFRESAVTRRTRDAFCGSLCAHHIRSRIEVSYYAVADALPLRAALTGAVKHAENRLRALLSVKSRLSVPPLKPAYREYIDDYFHSLSVKMRPNAATAPTEYDHLYDAPSRGLSVSAAREIEESSWETTKILLPEEESAAEPLSPCEAAPIPAPCPVGDRAISEALPSGEKNASVSEDRPSFSEEECHYLSLVLSGDRAGVARLLSEAGKLEEELAAHINELTADYFGDVVLESDGVSVHLVEDYEEEVSAWIL